MEGARRRGRIWVGEGDKFGTGMWRRWYWWEMVYKVLGGRRWEKGVEDGKENRGRWVWGGEGGGKW